MEEELRDLHNDILQMSGMVQEVIHKSIEALKGADKQEAQKVIDSDARIDELESVIDEKCIDLIARCNPTVPDLRFIAAAMKINAELERIADIAVGISQRVMELVDQPLLKPLEDIPKLSVVSQNMVANAIDAFIRKDPRLAKDVILSDADADRLRNLVQDELINDYMNREPAVASKAVPLLLIARYLERICDHATNIAEDVITMVQTKIIGRNP